MLVLPVVAAALAFAGAARAEAPGLPEIRVADAGGSTRYLVGTLRVAHAQLQLPDNGGAPALATASIDNRGRVPDALVGATLDGGGTAAVEPARLALPAGGTVDLSPDGPRVTVAGPAPSWKVGDSVRGVLLFERGGPLALAFTVVAPPPRP